MELRYQNNCQNIEWDKIPVMLERVGMSYTTAENHKLSFERSFSVIFVFDGNELIGFGRMLSDGIRQSALYDIAVSPEYQGLKIGKEIVQRLLDTTPECNFILYASPGKENFYKKMNFKKMKTGMALFSNPQRMIDRGYVEE